MNGRSAFICGSIFVNTLVLPSRYAASAGKRGTVHIDGPPGFSSLGLFVSPTGNVTTLPVFAP